MFPRRQTPSYRKCLRSLPAPAIDASPPSLIFAGRPTMRTLVLLFIAGLLACCGCRSAADPWSSASAPLEPVAASLRTAPQDVAATPSPTVGESRVSGRLVSGESPEGSQQLET